MTKEELHDELAGHFDQMYNDGKIVNLEPFKAFVLASYADQLKLSKERDEEPDLDKLCRKRLHHLTKPPKE
jgi:hypothetical protein